jgi:hypothetical protein
VFIALIIVLLRVAERRAVFYQDEIFYFNGIRTFITVNETGNFGHMLYVPPACYKLFALKIMSEVRNILKVNV